MFVDWAKQSLLHCTNGTCQKYCEYLYRLILHNILPPIFTLTLRAPSLFHWCKAPRGEIATDHRHILSYMAYRNEINSNSYNPLFSRSMILSHATGSQKSKMAASKMEIPLPRVVYKIAMKFQRLSPWFSIRPGPIMTFPTLPDIFRQLELNMAPSKPEVKITIEW